MIRIICQGEPPHFNQLSQIRKHFRKTNQPATEIVAAWYTAPEEVTAVVVSDADSLDHIGSLAGRNASSLVIFVDTSGSPDPEEYLRRLSVAA